MNLVPIKVKILSGQGNCLYPDFNQLDVVKQSGMDWSNYVDSEGSGWLYDKKCGHAEVDAASPSGIWLGMLLIPEEFALQAIAKFPDRITRLTEVDTEAFYNDRHACKMPDEEIDSDILQGIKLKKELGLTPTEAQKRALDPEDDTPGIRKNKKKKWADFKALQDISIVEAV